MKKIFLILSAFILLSSSFLSLDAEVWDYNKIDAPPGDEHSFGLSIDPTSCRTGVANEAGSGDYLYGSLWDSNSPEIDEWGEPVITYSAVEDTFYYTIDQTVSCEAWDGSHGEVRNTTYPCEHWVLRYEYNYL